MLSRKPGRCRHCKGRLERLGEVLHQDCIDPWLETQQKKKQAKEAREQRAKARVERAKDRARREALETIPQLIAKCQTVFNEYVRLRDRSKGCFVCGKPFPVGQLGGDFDAGHVRSRGAAGHLRFNEDNCHGECKSCNSSTGAKPHEIEAGAIRRIGQERYDALRNNNEPHKWTKDELRGLIYTYRAKLKALKAKT